MGSSVACNEAGSDHQLMSPVVGTVPDSPSTIGGSIAGNSARGYRCLGGSPHIGDSTTESSRFIASDGAADEL